MKGIVFANGDSLTQLHDKPKIYYPAKSLADAGVDEIIINTHNTGAVKESLSRENLPPIDVLCIEEGHAGIIKQIGRKISGIGGVMIIGSNDYLTFQLSPPTGGGNASLYVNYEPSNGKIRTLAEVKQGVIRDVCSTSKRPKGFMVHTGVSYFPDIHHMVTRSFMPSKSTLLEIAKAYVPNCRLRADECKGIRYDLADPEEFELAVEHRKYSKS